MEVACMVWGGSAVNPYSAYKWDCVKSRSFTERCFLEEIPIYFYPPVLSARLILGQFEPESGDALCDSLANPPAFKLSCSHTRTRKNETKIIYACVSGF